MNTSALKKTVQNKRLLTKKELLEIAVNDLNLNIDDINIYKLEQMKVSELREIFQKTHVIDGQLKNYTGYCFSCLRPLRPDYTRFENYCLDC